jgi:hypothetical protein
MAHKLAFAVGSLENAETPGVGARTLNGWSPHVSGLHHLTLLNLVFDDTHNRLRSFSQSFHMMLATTRPHQ